MLVAVGCHDSGQERHHGDRLMLRDLRFPQTIPVQKKARINPVGLIWPGTVWCPHFQIQLNLVILVLAVEQSCLRKENKSRHI